MLAVLDSDDMFDPRKLECVAPLAIEYGLASTEILFLLDPTGELLPNHNRRYADPLLTFEQALFAHTHTYSTLAWDRRLDGALLTEITRMEDTVLMASCFARVDRMFHVPVPLHHYYHRQGSLCNEGDAAAKFIRACELILERLDCGQLDVGKSSVNRTLAAFIARQLKLENAFEAGLAAGVYPSYQDFLARSHEARTDFDIPRVRAVGRVGRATP